MENSKFYNKILHYPYSAYKPKIDGQNIYDDVILNLSATLLLRY